MLEMLKDEQATIRVIAGGLTLVGDSNKSKKNYSRFAIASNDVLFNVPATKRAKTRHVPIIWIIDDDEERMLHPY